MEDITLGTKIANRIVFSDYHWAWPGAKTKRDGYARVYIYDASVMLHQTLYEAVMGHPPTDRMYNKCGMQSCLNPAHWQVGIDKNVKPMTPIQPIDWLFFRQRIAEILDTVASKTTYRCSYCSTILTTNERRQAEQYRNQGYSSFWANNCFICLDMFIAKAKNNRNDLEKRIIAAARRGRSIQWIASQYIGTLTETAGIDKVVGILTSRGYEVELV